MCTVSAVLPQFQQNPFPTFQPMAHTYGHIDVALATDMKAALVLLDKIDKRLGFLDCVVEGEDKQAFITKLQQIIDSEKAAK